MHILLEIHKDKNLADLYLLVNNSRKRTQNVQSKKYEGIKFPDKTISLIESH